MTPNIEIEAAVLREKMEGLREQQKAHADTANKRMDSVEHKLELIFETLNKQKGAYAFGLVAAGGAGIVGSMLVKALGSLWGLVR
jgi:hypothetical protein